MTFSTTLQPDCQTCKGSGRIADAPSHSYSFGATGSTDCADCQPVPEVRGPSSEDHLAWQQAKKALNDAAYNAEKVARRLSLPCHEFLKVLARQTDAIFEGRQL